MFSSAPSIYARFSHCQYLPSGSLHKPLSLLHQKADRRSKKNHNPTVTRIKALCRKLLRMKKQIVMSQMKGQIKTSEKQLNEMVIGNLPEKEFSIMIVKMIQDLRKTVEEIQEMFTKDLEELKDKQS